MKAGAISIQTRDELCFFMDHMRKLLVPQCLVSGKLSNHVLKAMQVYFEDANSEAKEASASSGNSKKVCLLNYAKGASLLTIIVTVTEYFSGGITSKFTIYSKSPG